MSPCVLIPHRYCDPDRAEREALGIPVDEPDPSEAAFWASENNRAKAAALAEAKWTAYWSCREQFWLDRLLDSGIWPVLFVCGSTHTERFRVQLAEGVTHA